MLEGLVRRRGGSNIRDVPTTAKKRVTQLLDIAAQTGVPAAQRDPDMLATLKVPQIGTAPRTADKTVRRLTRVERLLAAKVIEPHQAQACEWYAGIAALAWDTTGTTANYEGGGGGTCYAHAPDRLMAKHRDVADARDFYREARKMLGSKMADTFEAIVCRNEALGPTAAAAFPDLQRSRAGERLRLTLSFCANKLHERFGCLMGWMDEPVVRPVRAPAPMNTPDPARRTSATAAALITAEIDAAIVRHREAGGAADQLWVAPDVEAALRRETCVRGKFRDLWLVVRDGWRWGYVLVDSAEAAAA